MSGLRFILTAIILYPALGTIFGILLTLYKSENLKLKIVLLTFLRPMVFTTTLGLIFTSTFNNSLIWLSCFLVVITLRDIVFSKDKYFSKLIIIEDHVSIEYINTLLQTKHLSVSLDNKKEFKLSEMRNIMNYPASFTFVDESNIQRFIILNKKTWNSVNESLNAAINNFVKVELTN